MPSDRRLHPASILFSLGKSAKAFLLPGLLLLVSSGRRSDLPFGSGWEFWFMLLMIPGTIGAVAQYLTFRLRYDGSELVIRSGVLFRNERKIPYSRIQNLDAIQNPLHRLLRVVEVRVETGQGGKAEATISVLPLDAFSEMRRRVFEGRSHALDAEQPAAPGPSEAPSEARSEAPAARTDDAYPLLTLPFGELLLFGFLDGRGSVILGALVGLLWELRLLDAAGDMIFGDNSYGGGYLAEIVRTVSDGQRLSLQQVGLAVAVLVALLVFVRLLSMVWAVVRLFGFRLTRAGDDLRTTFGLLTRVVATVPRRRIQTVTILEGPLYRLLGRVGVRVETAGGAGPGSESGSRERAWLAPLIKRDRLPELLRQVDPGLDLEALPWHPVAPRAVRRAVKPRIAFALLLSAVLAWPLGWWALGVLIVALVMAVVSARKFVEHLAWATTADVVALRGGWMWRSLKLARTAKIQAVMQRESPFDRRSGMAEVHVDTAGASVAHRMHIPYLPRETAQALRHRLALQAASSTFRW